MKVLNLYAGIGGNRKLWEGVEVTAVEQNEDVADVYRSFFPNDIVIVGDAHQYLLDHYKEFDFIWSSPPCPTHSIANKDYGVQIGTLMHGTRKRIIREAQIPELMSLHGFDLSKINIPNKRQVLRNCVFPELGLHILDCARNIIRKEDTKQLSFI